MTTSNNYYYCSYPFYSQPNIKSADFCAVVKNVGAKWLFQLQSYIAIMIVLVTIISIIVIINDNHNYYDYLLPGELWSKVCQRCFTEYLFSIV